MIKAVLMDIDNTLLDFNECARWAMKKSYEDFGLAYKESMFAVFTATNDFLWGEIEKGKLTRDGLLLVRWKKIFEKLNIDFDGITFEDRFRTYIEQSGHKVKDADTIMDYLKGKYAVYAASNGFERHQIGRLTVANLIDKFDGIFVSEKAGYSKPQKEFFDYCMQRMGEVKREEIIIIGDSIHADMKGGIDYGIKTCYFDYKNTNNCHLKVDYTIKKLLDIYKIL